MLMIVLILILMLNFFVHVNYYDNVEVNVLKVYVTFSIYFVYVNVSVDFEDVHI